MRGYLFVLLVAATVTYLTTPAVRRLARRVGGVTPLRERDVHTVPIPRLGGAAIYFGIAMAMLMASQIRFFEGVFTGRTAYVVLLSAGAVCLLGVLDDLWELDAVTKAAGQALAAGIMAWQGIQLVSLPIFGTFIPSRMMLIFLTVLAIMVTINAVNFVDGLDGLAAGITAISGAAFFVYSYLLARDSSPSDYASLASVITAALVGACVGFLPHNFNPARIFMGDSGSMLLGLLMATSTVAITGTVEPATLEQAAIVPAFLPLVLPLAVLALPLIDLLLAILRRTRAGKMPWQPDKLHLHHRMLSLGHSHAGAVLILYFWTATVGFGVALYSLLSPARATLIGGAAVLCALILTVGPRRWRQMAATAVPGGPRITTPGSGPRTATVVVPAEPDLPRAAADPDLATEPGGTTKPSARQIRSPKAADGRAGDDLSDTHRSGAGVNSGMNGS
ncbi:undecaprenyl/decaprenyl-phosphate alpha-N-acetylglucosaminyl 1-phosphate transferase [Kineosporia sp. J2-2]|uniref:Undecaprenyl/decaprenyl-phosphate alpha-N-acetylglucosaminyl 1-phosphate transferase n=1 Tax=Kineosporia corallincola TaxID=2835133 RepID=A0ABS5TLT5_9ACTN|nr:MraY family glycosyltransferase [Kineosporia corallincola]MBT0772069.1 undecaprenyl/decaprenyl-phosphate alpha-N-acetylglucosaminyl 1-phosphate transferase [Kineosporia corallincola]